LLAREKLLQAYPPFVTLKTMIKKYHS